MNFRKLTILTIIAVLFILSINLQICMPDGCFYNPQSQVCQEHGCINEDIGSHLQERSMLSLITINRIIVLFYLLISTFLLYIFSTRKGLSDCHSKIATILSYFSIEHNFLTVLFSSGILKPKIF
jgi:hypothetical protein